MNGIDKEIIRGEKVPANPIPEKKYEQFKYKLEEVSGDLSERNMMLFYLGVATGYRMQDIIKLTIGEIKQSLDDGEFNIQEQKQQKSWEKHIKKNPNSKKKNPKKRIVLIKSSLRKFLKEYIKGKSKSEYAFKSSKSNNNITVKAYSDILSRVGKSLEIEHISGHSLRKTYITRIWDATGDIEKCRKAIGHKSIETTKQYLGLESEVREESAQIADCKL